MIAILCPTKRPIDFEHLVENVRRTSGGRVTVMAYVDEEDEQRYAQFFFDPTVAVTVGPRVGPAAALNLLIEDRRRFGVYGLIPDDARIVHQDWDLWMEPLFDRFPGRLGVVSPAQGGGVEYCNFPFVTRELVDLMGWFSPPQFYHFIYDSVWELLAEEADCLYRCTVDEMQINHQAQGCLNIGSLADDTEKFLTWSRMDRLHQLRKIRQAQASSAPKKSNC